MRKYEKMKQVYDAKFLEKVNKNIWCQITEKLHGANFSFQYKDGELTHCTRNQVITPETNFHGYQELFKYNKAVLDIVEAYDGLNVIVYGEFVGPGIQKGVDYGEKDFYCFDILVNNEYVSPSNVTLLCTIFNIPHVPVLDINTLDKALEYCNEFDSKVLGKKDNVCEGIVIKPLQPQFIGEHRVIFKSKNEKFAEKASCKNKANTPLSPEKQETLDTLLNYMVESRVDAVMSKQATWEFGPLMKTMMLDMLEDAKLDYPSIDFSGVTKYATKMVSNFIRPYYLKARTE